MLMRYQAHRVVVNANIKEMFLQFPVAERDRDFLAFLWHVDTPQQNPTYSSTYEATTRLQSKMLSSHRQPCSHSSSSTC